VIAAIGQQQSADGVRGGLAEIGVHHGKLFFILSLLRRDGEKLLAMDLFEDDEGNRGTSQSGRDTAFFRNIEALGVPVAPDEILKCNSLEVSARDIEARTGPVRLFSIDGGHLYQHVENDLQLALDCLHERGVVIIDDFCTARWPEVTFAAYDFLRAEKAGLAPFLITKSKLYACRTAAVPYYQSMVRSNPVLSRYHSDQVEIVGQEVAFLVQPNWQVVVDEARARLF
jgi:hypothetical protein